MDTSPPEQRRFLVIGCGSIGKRHIGNLLSLGVPDVIAFDIQASRREEVEERLHIPVLNSLEEAWQHRPEVAVVAAPTSLHVPLSLEVAKHGCHLFIEKPLSHTMEGVDELLRAVKEKNLITLVGCNMRFHPGIMRVKNLIDEGAIGKVVAARLEAGQYLPDWHPWEDYRNMYSARRELGGGVILDAIHEIDLAHWMLGEVEAVACFAGKLSHLEIDTEDTAAVLLRFANGAIGELHLDYIQRVYSRSCHIIGEEGTILWDFNKRQVKLYSAQTGRWQAFPQNPGYDINEMYIEEMKHFLNCLEGKTKPMLGINSAKIVLKTALAAKEAAKEARIVWLKE